MKEIEAKILKVNLDDLRTKLRRIGVKKVFGSQLLEEMVFDHEELQLENKGCLLRLRRFVNQKSGELTFKGQQEPDSQYKKREEYNVRVEFEEMKGLLLALGFRIIRYRQKKREEWQWGKVKIEIDQYPKIPAYLEIEGPSKKDIERVAQQLGFNKDQLTKLTATEVLKYYKVKDPSFIKF